MKFNYLKLTLLMATLVGASVSAQGTVRSQADEAAKLAVSLLDMKGPRRTVHETVAVVDQIIGKVDEFPALRQGLHEFKGIAIQFDAPD